MTSPLFYKLQCPACAGKFRWLFGDPEPNFCPLCSSAVAISEEAEEFTPKAPMIAKPGNKVPEAVYRGMEASSIARADAAYEAGGGDRSDYTHMHITNLRDNMKEGEVAAMPSQNPVQRFMTQNPQAPMGNQPFNAAAGYAAAAHQPIVMPNGKVITNTAYAGATAAGQVQEQHFGRMQTLLAKGQINR